MQASRLIIYVTFILTISFSCTKRSPHTFETETAGTTLIVTNTGGPRYHKPIYSIEESLSLGGETPEPTLYQPYGLLVDEQENIYCVDEERIKKFDAEGRYLQHISRPGQGPGEVSNPTLAGIMGDTLIIGQNVWSGWRKFELLSTDGDFIARVPFPRLKVDQAPRQRKSAVALLRNLNFLFTVENPLTDDRNAPHQWSYGIADADGQVVTMLDLDIKPFKLWVWREDQGTVLPFVVGSEHTIGKYIYILSDEGRKIDIFDQRGILQRSIHLNLAQEKLTSDDIKRVQEGRSRRGNPSILIASDFPELMPLTSELIVDDEDRMWLQKGAGDFGYRPDVYTYMVLSPEGEYIADQTFPFPISVVKNKKAYGYTTDEDGIRVLKRFELVKN